MGRFFVAMGFGIVMPIIPIYALQIGGSLTDSGLVLSVYQLSMVIFQTPFGRLSDKIGRKPILLIGLIVYSIGSFFCSMVSSIEQMILLRALQGIGASMFNPVSQVILTDLVPENMRGTIMGACMMVLNLGWFASPVLGGIISDTMDMRIVFIICGALTITSIVPIFLYVPETAKKKIGNNEKIKAAIPSSAKSTLTFLFIATFLSSVNASLVLPLIRNFMYLFGATITEIGIVTSAFGITSAVFQGPAGALSDKRGRKKLIIPGYFLISIILPVYVLAKDTMQFIVIRAFHGVASALTGPTVLALLADITTREVRGTVMSSYNTAMSLGMVIGPTLGAYLAEQYGYEFPFYLCFFVGLVATVVLQYGIKEVRKPPNT